MGILKTESDLSRKETNALVHENCVECAWRMATIVTLFVVVITEVIVVSVYWVLDREELQFHMIMTAIVSVVVSFPISLYFAKQRQKLDRALMDLNMFANFDALSGLMSRANFLETADDVIWESGATRSVSLLFIDADRFKRINDTYGHLAGDRVIAGIGQAITRSIDPKDIAGRVGGEEFCVLLPDLNETEAARVAERISAAVRRLETMPRSLEVSVSIGVAELRFGDNFDALISRADSALYGAKRAGKDQVVCWSEGRPSIRVEDRSRTAA